jgi:2-oxoglutarate dehydrogenase E2 component (dihydrolipoamide succinyltransferase)
MAELIAITAPADQEEGTEMVVAGWLKNVGDQVAENEPLLEISTDKVTVEIASPAAGILREIVQSAEQPVGAGEVLGRIEVGAAWATKPAAPAREPAATGAAAPAAELTPAVRRLLAEHGLQASAITGTGRDGRITAQDVESYLAARKGAPAKADSPSAAAGASAIPSRKVPHTGMRRSIAQHMTQSVATAPHVTSVFEADLSAIVAHREAHRAAFDADGVKLTFTAYFVRASVAALQAVPEANSRWHDDALELFEDCNIGIATALPQGGLILPVIQRAQTLDL